MSRFVRLALSLTLLAAGLPAIPVMAQSTLAIPPESAYCQYIWLNGEGNQPFYLICMPQYLPYSPTPWNGDLVVYAHGYVPPNASPTAWMEQLYLVDQENNKTFLPAMVNSLGYAFAATSYSKNGLAVKEAVSGGASVISLVSYFKDNIGKPTNTYLTGASEGGLVTTLAVEKHPQIFSGGLATCGPIGDFRAQINYFGDFRVIFDYFFPGVLPPSPISIPNVLLAEWESLYAPQVAYEIGENQLNTTQLLSVTKAPIDPLNPNTVIETTLGVLWYNVFSTNEAQEELKGQPYDNSLKLYTGSLNDSLLNSTVERYNADPAALAQIHSAYQTSGRLKVPLITMHTTGDPIVPYWQEILYAAKTMATGSTDQRINIPIERYGHCSFAPSEILLGFNLLVWKVTGAPIMLSSVEAALPDVMAQSDYLRLSSEQGVPVK